MNKQDPKRHGGPADRGAADWWYQRWPKPHMFEGATHNSPLIEEANMKPEDIKAYWDGYNEAKEAGDHKWS